MLAPLVALALAAAPLDGFDAWVDQQLVSWQQPGVAVAIVKDGKVELLKGYGQRDVARKLPVTARTLFSIGSVSKSFTALALARAVDEGKLDWDAPVRERMPEFALMDPVASDHCSARDLVLHRTGLGRHDFLNFMLRDATRAEIVSRLRWLEPHQPFRERFDYNNLGFVVAGRLAEVVTKKRYEELIREEIFTPLGMKTASTIFKDFTHSPDHSLGYQRDAAGTRLTRDFSFANDQTEANPAGSLVASAEDLSRYVLFHLGDGAPLLKPDSFAELHRPQQAVPDPAEWPEVSTASYALGWYVASYRGHRLVFHTGATRGFTSIVALLPDDHLGAAVVGNVDDAPLPRAVAFSVFDRYLGLEPAPWSDRLRPAAPSAEAKPPPPTQRRLGTQPAHPLDEYAGTYQHPAYGALTVTRDKDALRLRVGPEDVALDHFHYETFIARDEPSGRVDQLRFEFVTDARGEVGAVRAAFEATTHPIEFQRAPDPKLVDPKYLATLAGHYALGAQVLDVALRGTQLHLVTPSGEDHLLVPRRANNFDVADLPAQSLRFDGGNQLIWFGTRSTLVFHR